MSLTYDFPTKATDGDFIIEVIGDGTSTVITFALLDPPFNCDLKGNLPVGVLPPEVGGVQSLILSTDRKKVTITFDSAPATGSRTQIHVGLVFAGA